MKTKKITIGPSSKFVIKPKFSILSFLCSSFSQHREKLKWRKKEKKRTLIQLWNRSRARAWLSFYSIQASFNVEKRLNGKNKKNWAWVWLPIWSWAQARHLFFAPSKLLSTLKWAKKICQSWAWLQIRSQAQVRPFFSFNSNFFGCWKKLELNKKIESTCSSTFFCCN